MRIGWLGYASAACFLAFATTALTEDNAPNNSPSTIWTTGKALMPGWGLFPNGETYGGTKSLDDYAAWRAGRLTWVTEFPADAAYEVFVRRYAGSGRTVVTIDDGAPVKGGRGLTQIDNAPNDRYRWEHVGQVQVTKGQHHVDLDIEGIFDAIVFTTDTALDPGKDKLPEPVKRPLLRAPRKYRDDSHLKSDAGGLGFVVAAGTPYQEMLNDYAPPTNQVIKTLRLWGAADQYVNGSFVVRALRSTEPLTVSLSQLLGPMSEQRSPSPLSSPPLFPAESSSMAAGKGQERAGRGSQPRHQSDAPSPIPSPLEGQGRVSTNATCGKSSVTPSPLGGEGRVRGVVRIGTGDIDLRVVGLRRRTLNLVENCSRAVLLPDLLLRDDRTAIPPKGKQGGYGGGTCVTAIPAHESRQFWLTVHVPAGSPPGHYRGTIRLKNSFFRGLTLPVELEVLPIDLKPVDGYYVMFHPSHPIPPEVRKLDGSYIKPERYRAELKDQVRHGCNAATLYGGPATLSHAKEAGTTQTPVVMQWPAADSHATEYVAQAKAMGFPDLYFYGVDEPREPDRLEQCRKEAEWRVKNGFHMITAINSRESYEVLKDLVDHPILSMNVFSGPDNPAAMYARSKGFVPVSYWMASTHYPLWHRSLAGLYNTRCGFMGTSAWSYQDFTDHRVYDENDWFQAISYPDEFEQPIPSLAWEGYRAGVDDVRYLQALDRAIAAAEGRMKKPDPPTGLAESLARAHDVRKTRFESIDGQYWQYLLGLKPDVLDATRREMAEVIVIIGNAMRP